MSETKLQNGSTITVGSPGEEDALRGRRAVHEETWEVEAREGVHNEPCVKRVGPFGADHCHWCGPVLTGDFAAAKLAAQAPAMARLLLELVRSCPWFDGEGVPAGEEVLRVLRAAGVLP